MAAYNRGNRGGYNGGGRGGSCGSAGGNGGRDGDGHSSKNLPDVKGRFDRFCVWCGEVIGDMALERNPRCPNNRCYRGIPINGLRRRRDGIQRCSRCYAISHRSFLYCELCSRPRTERDLQAFHFNMDGIDPYMVDLPENHVPVPVPAAAPAAAAPGAAAAAAAQVIVAAVVAPERPPTPVADWANAMDDDDFPLP